MSNTYKPVSEWAKPRYGEDVFEHKFSASEESDLIGNGHLELVPRKYRVLSHNYSAGKQGEEFEAALPVDVEVALLGAHIERVEEKPKQAAKKTLVKKSSSDD